jgi:hypothetical protein
VCFGERTRGKRLLELLGLVGVLEDEGVDVPRAADLELDVVDLLVLLDARGYTQSASFLLQSIIASQSSPFGVRVPICIFSPSLRTILSFFCGVLGVWIGHVHWASLRRQISMNCLMSETSAGILAAGGVES